MTAVKFFLFYKSDPSLYNSQVQGFLTNLRWGTGRGSGIAGVRKKIQGVP